MLKRNQEILTIFNMDLFRKFEWEKKYDLCRGYYWQTNFSNIIDRLEFIFVFKFTESYGPEIILKDIISESKSIFRFNKKEESSIYSEFIKLVNKEFYEMYMYLQGKKYISYCKTSKNFNLQRSRFVNEVDNILLYKNKPR